MSNWHRNVGIDPSCESSDPVRFSLMDVRIGIAESGQIIEIEMADDTDREALKAEIGTALTSAENTTLWLADVKGHETGISSNRISFVELKNADAEPRIGFGA